MKKIISIMTVFLLSAAFFYANTVSFQSDNYTGTISYNDTAKPGDAVFARMTLKISKNIRKKNATEPVAVLQLLKNDRKIENSQFYFINSRSKRFTNPEMLAGLPISLWLTGEPGYSIKIIFSTGISGDTDKEIILPISIQPVEWNKEILELNDTNSKIKQNMSPERLAQTEKLSTILETVLPMDVYSLKSFVLPVNSAELTSEYGDKRIYRYTDGKSSAAFHYGNDYGVQEGTDVYSCSDGKVVMAEFRISTGWSVVIEHLPGLYSLYYHLSSLSVKEGNSVKQGEKIGLSGSTGLSTGPHLHWEVRLNNAPVKPDFFMSDFTFSSQE